MLLQMLCWGRLGTTAATIVAPGTPTFAGQEMEISVA